MIHGSCLCGSIRFEFTKPASPFELCHCRRCRKVTGSAFFSGLYARLSRIVLQPMRFAGAESSPGRKEISRPFGIA